MPVFEQIGPVLASEYVEALPDAALVEPRIRQPRAARKQGVFVRLQHAPDEPDELLVALVVVGRHRMRRRRGWGGSVEAGAATRVQITHRDQTVIRLDHCEAADRVTFGKVAD